MRLSRATAFVLSMTVATSLALTGCGSDKPSSKREPAKHAASSPALKTEDVTPEPSKEPTSGFGRGIIVTSCEGSAGETIVVTSYDPDTGEQLARTEINKPAIGDTFSAADCFAMQSHRQEFRMEGAFSPDFTQVYATVTNADGTSTVGTVSQDGTFTPIVAANSDDFGSQKFEFPALDSASGRLVFWDNGGDQSKLVSTKMDGTDMRPETAAQAKLYQDYLGEVFALPNAQEVAPLDRTSTSAYNDAGTLVARVDTGDLQIGKPPLANDFQGVKIPDNGPYRCDVVTFLGDDKTVVCEDGSQIYELKIQGGTVKVTTLVANKGELGIKSVALSEDGSHLAFLGQLAGTTALYTVPVTGGKPEKLVENAGNAAVLLGYRS